MAGLLIGVLVVWVLVPAFVAQYIGQEKGRLGWAWGLCLGWFGVLIVAVLPPSPEHEKVTTNRRAAMYRECPHCKEQMRRDATVCPHCRGVSPAESLSAPVARLQAGHSPEAKAQLEAAEKYLLAGKYPQVMVTLEEARYEALRRGDAEGLEAALELATRLEAAPNVHRRIHDDAQDFIEAGREQLAALRVTLAEADDEVADAESSAPSEVATPPTTPDAESGVIRSASALEIARERYARGEISRDEFLQLQSDLGE